MYYDAKSPRNKVLITVQRNFPLVQNIQSVKNVKCSFVVTDIERGGNSFVCPEIRTQVIWMVVENQAAEVPHLPALVAALI